MSFDTAVWRVVANIEPGQVMSYGEVARVAGFPGHARMVSKALRRSDAQLPWYRVVKSDRTLAFKPGSEAYTRQKGLLEAEGARVVHGKVIVPESSDVVDLDRLIWGPPG